MEYALAKCLHVLSSTLLFGTGLGSAFYMLVVSRTRDAHAIAVVARYVVIADWAFTTPTVTEALIELDSAYGVIQPPPSAL